MILLLLVLAIVLTTSSSFLVASSSGGGDEDRKDSQLAGNTPELGEISGSLSVTARGELWLTVLIDDISILAQLEIVKSVQGEKEYSFSLACIDLPNGEADAKSAHSLLQESGETVNITFGNPIEASTKLLSMFDEIGIVISKEALRSIPYAVDCGWKSPQECERLVQQMVDEQL